MLPAVAHVDALGMNVNLVLIRCQLFLIHPAASEHEPQGRRGRQDSTRPAAAAHLEALSLVQGPHARHAVEAAGPLGARGAHGKGGLGPDVVQQVAAVHGQGPAPDN